MPATAVVVLSMVPGLASLLLRGRSTLPWSLGLIAALALAPVVSTLTLFVFPFPYRELRFWSQEVIFWGTVAAVITLSVRRSLRDRADIMATGGVPAYRRGWSGAWPVLLVLVAIGLIALMYLGLMLIALGGISAAK
jgi:hypothetical protein